MIDLGFKVIDIHTHLRDAIKFHTGLANKAEISCLVYMPNTTECLDTRQKIVKSLKADRLLRALPVSALTIGRKGKELVNIREIKDLVVGFSDDGDCLNNLSLLEEALKAGVLVMAHLEPEYEMAKRYLKVLKKVGGRLHLQHISEGRTVKLIRRHKLEGLKITCETCPQYFTFNKKIEDIYVNPPIGDDKDVLEIKRGLADGTIDVIASDYAPLPRPRQSGFASFESFLALSYSLVLEGAISKKLLKDKLYNNPKEIICRSGLKI